MTKGTNSTDHDWTEDDAPDMTDPYWLEKFSKAPLIRGARAKVTPKVAKTISIDADILARFRAGEAGWQSRINAALRQWLEEHSDEA